jgi:hypothetical protein
MPTNRRFTAFLFCDRLQNEILAAHGQASISYWVILSTDAFLDLLKAKSRKEKRKHARQAGGISGNRALCGA